MRTRPGRRRSRRRGFFVSSAVRISAAPGTWRRVRPSIHLNRRRNIRHATIHLPLRVAQIALVPEIERTVRLIALSAGFDGASGRIRAEIRIDAYLTKKVPDRLRRRTCWVRTEGDVLAEAARMYKKIYEEDERLGGENTIQRSKRLKREGKPEPLLLNRDDGPYVHLHDLEDLYFETLSVRWTGQRSCVASVGIGS